MNKLQIGLVGCGLCGNIHIDHLLKIKYVDLCALADTNPYRLEQSGRKAQAARLYTDGVKMLEKERLDALFICVPPYAHGALEIKAAELGVALYIEKPISASWETAIEIHNKIEQYGIICSVGYQERYSPLLIQLKQALSKDPCRLVVGYWMDSIPDKFWCRRKERSGGQLVEHTSHLLDTFRLLFGEAVCLYCLKGAVGFQPKMNIDGFASFQLQFESGTIANVVSGCFLPLELVQKDRGFIAYSEHGIYQYNWFKDLTIVNGLQKKQKKNDNISMGIAVEIFLKAVQVHDQSLIQSNYHDAMKTLRLCLDISEFVGPVNKRGIM